MTRVFVCIELSESLRSEIASQLSVLRSIRTEVRWVERRNLHITLKFLGDVSRGRVDTVMEVLEVCAKDARAFTVNVEGIGAFPSVANPRVLWIGVTRGLKEISALASSIDAQLSCEGFTRERRDFSPHLTIGRAKSPKNTDELNYALSKMQQAYFGEMKVGTITVMESKLYNSGPVYSPLRRICLRS